MALLIFLRLIVAIVFLAFVVSQIILPILSERKLFPMFRKSTNIIENQIRETQSQIDEKALKDKLAALQSQLNPPAVPTSSTDADNKQ